MARSPARMWLMALGFALLAVAILGLIPAAADMMHGFAFHIEGGEDWVHWALALLTLGVAFGMKDEAMLANFTIAYGIVYLAVGALGFFVDTIGAWHVALGDNLLHLALGLATLGAGIASRKQAPLAATGRTAMGK